MTKKGKVVYCGVEDDYDEDMAFFSVPREKEGAEYAVVSVETDLLYADDDF